MFEVGSEDSEHPLVCEVFAPGEAITGFFEGRQNSADTQGQDTPTGKGDSKQLRGSRFSLSFETNKMCPFQVLGSPSFPINELTFT